MDDANLEMLHQEEGDEHMDDQEPKADGKLPPLTRKVILDFILKYEATGNECAQDCFRVINECIEEASTFLQYSLKLLHHMIRTNREVMTGSHQTGFNVVQRIKFYLIKIRNLKDLDEEDVLIELSQSEVYLCLADLA